MVWKCLPWSPHEGTTLWDFHHPCEPSWLSRNRSWHRVDDASQQLPAGDLWKEPRIEVMDIFMLFSLPKLWISSPKHGEDTRFSFFQRFWRRRSHHTKILSRAMCFFFFFHDPKMGDMAHFVPWILQGSTWRIRVHCQISTKLHGPCRTSAWRRVLALIKEWGAWGFYGILEPSNLRIVLEWCRIQPGTRKESWRWGTDVLSNGI